MNIWLSEVVFLFFFFFLSIYSSHNVVKMVHKYTNPKNLKWVQKFNSIFNLDLSLCPWSSFLKSKIYNFLRKLFLYIECIICDLTVISNCVYARVRVRPLVLDLTHFIPAWTPNQMKEPFVTRSMRGKSEKDGTLWNSRMEWNSSFRVLFSFFFCMRSLYKILKN